MELKKRCILILYTTLYRSGGKQFELAAKTLQIDKRKILPDLKIICKSVESKKDFLKEIDSLAHENLVIDELHFIGHSGVYGIMFGTTDWPEQFSPYEWKNISLPIDNSSKLYFHACRSARWLAPFLSEHFKVSTYGYWWYTTVSGSNNKFKWLAHPEKAKNVYIVSCAGKKSHGYLASILKYLHFSKIYPMMEFKPSDLQIDRSYDQVSNFYENTFHDLSVRSDEWEWLTKNLDFNKDKIILDIGCGNGSFLRHISKNIQLGLGVDASAGMIKVAQNKLQELNINNINFQKIDGPKLSFEDNSVDVVTSTLSFRYLDWDPILSEILRVLKPGGKILILDMVAAPVKFVEYPKFLFFKFKHYFQRVMSKKYYKALKKMVNTQEWQQMLKYNPIRAEHEYVWFFKSRFPNCKISCINIGWNSRILTFNSGPIYFKEVKKMSFP